MSSSNKIESFFIRRRNLMKILDKTDLQTVVHGYKTRILLHYIKKIHHPLVKEQQLIEEYNQVEDEVNLKNFLATQKQKQKLKKVKKPTRNISCNHVNQRVSIRQPRQNKSMLMKMNTMVGKLKGSKGSTSS